MSLNDSLATLGVATLALLALVALGGGAYLAWLGHLPTRDPHGGALVMLPGIGLLAIGVPLAVLAGQAASARRRARRRRDSARAA